MVLRENYNGNDPIVHKVPFCLTDLQLPKIMEKALLDTGADQSALSAYWRDDVLSSPCVNLESVEIQDFDGMPHTLYKVSIDYILPNVMTTPKTAWFILLGSDPDIVTPTVADSAAHNIIGRDILDDFHVQFHGYASPKFFTISIPPANTLSTVALVP